jgi:hypothetical protein
MMLRNSERSSWKTCRWRWHWTYRDGLQAREAPHALRFGDLIHQALAAYYKPGIRRGPAPAATFERLYADQAKRHADSGFDVRSDDKWVDALPLGVNMLENYVRTYKDADGEFEVISSEQTFQRVIRASRPDDAPTSWPGQILFKIVGTLDGVWRHRRSGRIIFKEFKTAAALTEDGLPMDEQPSLYWTYGPKWLRRKGILAPGDGDPREILYTFLRKQLVPEWTPEGQPIGPSGKVVRPVFARIPVYRDAAERQALHRRVIAEAFEIHAARHGHASIYKNPGPLHMPNCRGCSVREACEVHEAGGDWFAVRNATTTRWAPYAAHELPERS